MATVTERSLVPRPPGLSALVPDDAHTEVRHTADDGTTTVTYYDRDGTPVLTVSGIAPARDS